MECSELDFERTYYTFDSATVENGYIELSDTKTLIYFPPLPQPLSTVPQEFHIFLDEHLIFSFKWLPFFSSYDYYRIKDMFFKCLYYLSYYYKPPPLTSPYRMFEKKITSQLVKNFTIYTHEEPPHLTSIQITRRPPPANVSPTPLAVDLRVPDHVFQIMIGHSIVFCSERDLPGLSLDEALYIVGYIIHKITDI
jgi:hypothetical protein